MAEEVLLLEGTPELKGGRDMLMPLSGEQRVCVDWQEVWSPALGKYVKRCKRYAPATGVSGLSGLGQIESLTKAIGLDIETAKNTLIQGGLIAGGAWLARKVADWLATVGKEEGEEPRLKGAAKDIVMILTGIVLGGIVGKAFKRPDLGFAIGVGPAAFVALSLLEDIIGKKAEAGTEGLGAITVKRVPVFEPASTPPISQYVGGVSAATSLV